MYPQRAPVALEQNLEIAPGLCCLDNTERVFLPRNRQIDCIVASDLQEDSRIRPTFIGLSGGMQVARSKTQAGCNMLGIAHQVPDGLQFVVVRPSHGNECEKGKVITRRDPGEMGSQVPTQRRVVASNLR